MVSIAASHEVVKVASKAVLCESPGRIAGDHCYKRFPTNMNRWCPVCLDGHDPSGPLPSWMGGKDSRRDDSYRPTTDDRYYPSVADDLEAAELLNVESETNESDDHDDDQAAHLFHTGRLESAFGCPNIDRHPIEMIEAGYRPFHPGMHWEA